MEDFGAFRWGKSNIEKIKDWAIVQTTALAINQGNEAGVCLGMK